MKTMCRSLLPCLVFLFVFSSVAFSSGGQNVATQVTNNGTTATIEAVNTMTRNELQELSLVNLMVDLLDSDIEYRLGESSTLVVVCNPFTAEQQDDDRIYQPTSNISVGLKFSF